MISTIIPTRNRAKSLQKTLEALFRCRPDFDYEIIVVDNGSTDHTAAICGLFSAKDWSFRYVFDDEPGLLTGRHKGASSAVGDILCFLDDDVEVSPGWFAGVQEAFSDDLVQLATGPSEPIYHHRPPRWLDVFWDKIPPAGKACTWLSLLDLGPDWMVIHPNYVWGLNFCIRKQALWELGGFHPDNIPAELQMFQGDGETGLTRKAFERGFKALYHPDVAVQHHIGKERLTVAYFKKRAFYQGVCNSFTSLRVSAEGKSLLTNGRASAGILRRMRRKLSEVRVYITNPEGYRMKKLLMQEEQRGFEFHQQAFNNNPVVRDWVLQPDYWEYKLPR